MWDPLVNEFPDTVHGFRCMLACKYLQALEKEYEPNTLGHDLIRDLISVLRAKKYVEATRRYFDFLTRLKGTSSSELRQPLCEPCYCPYCPRHKQTSCMGQSAHVQEAQNVQNVQKP
nr:movement protein [West African Asystasia virus 2]BDQ69149.1 movement protein [West African Asystasia virus 2]